MSAISRRLSGFAIVIFNGHFQEVFEAHPCQELVLILWCSEFVDLTFTS